MRHDYSVGMTYWRALEVLTSWYLTCTETLCSTWASNHFTSIKCGCCGRDQTALLLDKQPSSVTTIPQRWAFSILKPPLNTFSTSSVGILDFSSNKTHLQLKGQSTGFDFFFTTPKEAQRSSISNITALHCTEPPFSKAVPGLLFCARPILLSRAVMPSRWSANWCSTQLVNWSKPVTTTSNAFPSLWGKRNDAAQKFEMSWNHSSIPFNFLSIALIQNILVAACSQCKNRHISFYNDFWTSGFFTGPLTTE